MNARHVHSSLPRPVSGSPMLRTGLFTGALLVLVMLASLFVANRAPALESFAWIRNDICRVAFGLVMLIPIFRFFAAPRRMFAAALLGWFIFVVGYDFAGMYFTNLFACLRRTPFQAFILGIVFYGIVAVVSWVAWMVLAATHDPIVAARRHVHPPHQR